MRTLLITLALLISLGSVSAFADCGNATYNCVKDGRVVGHITLGKCGHMQWYGYACDLCHPSEKDTMCGQRFPGSSRQ